MDIIKNTNEKMGKPKEIAELIFFLCSDKIQAILMAIFIFIKIDEFWSNT